MLHCDLHWLHNARGEYEILQIAAAQVEGAGREEVELDLVARSLLPLLGLGLFELRGLDPPTAESTASLVPRQVWSAKCPSVR